MAKLTKNAQAELRGIAAEWRTFRTSNLFTQAQLAAVIGLSRRQVQNIEGGKCRPTFSTASRFRILKAKHDKSKGA